MTKEGKCQRCNKYSRSLHLIEDHSWTLIYEDLLGVSASDSQYFCAECAGVQEVAVSLPISIPKLIDKKRKQFTVNLFKGKIAQAIVEIIFLEFGFEVFPFGYESYFTSIIRSLSGHGSISNAALRLRSMPDLMVFEPNTKLAYLVEIKSTRKNCGEYKLEATSADRYVKFWAESLLIVVCAKSHELFVAQVSTLDLPNRLKRTFPDGKEGYALNLQNDFLPLESKFKFDGARYKKLLDQLIGCLNDYT